MWKIFILFFILSFVGCGYSTSSDFDIECDSNAIGPNPDLIIINTDRTVPLFICTYPEMSCGGDICVNVAKDGRNCGWCGVKCDKGEMCYAYHCVNPTYFGYSEGDLVNGPVPYIPQKDLPRPNQTSK